MAQYDPSGRFLPTSSNPTVYTISPAGSKGLGCFAKQTLHRGTHLVTETPLFTLPSNQTGTESVDRKLIALPLQTQTNFDLSDYKKRKIGEKRMTSLARFKRNRLPLDANGLFGAFLHASRFNHSCMPNAHLYYDAPKQQMCIHVLAPEIEEGKEITIDYVYNGVYKTRSARSQVLKRYDFACNCGACWYTPGANDQQSKIQARRSRIWSLQDGLVLTAGTIDSVEQRGVEIQELFHLLKEAAREGDHLYGPRSCALKLAAEWQLERATMPIFDKDGDGGLWREGCLDRAEKSVAARLKLDKEATGEASSKVADTNTWIDGLGLFESVESEDSSDTLE